MASQPHLFTEESVAASPAAQALTEELSQLREQIELARTSLYQLRKGGDTKLIETTLHGLTLAKVQIGNAARELARDRSGDAMAAIIGLLEILHNQIASRDNLDELDREVGEAGGGSAARARHWAAVEQHFERFSTATGRICEASVAFAHDIDSRKDETMDETNNAMAQAVRELGNTISMLGNTGSGGTGRIGRRYEAVADQLAASLDAYGLPHDGGQIVRAGDPDAARSRLIDGLRRNFAHRDQDGMRQYYQTDAQPVTRDRYDRSRLLRGGALVNANLLAAEADAVVAILDRLPSMARFERARGVAGLHMLRNAVRAHLDNLVDCVRDPMGLNRARAGFEFNRLIIATFDYFDEAEILDLSLAPKSLGELESAVATLGKLRDEQLTVAVGIVRDEEIGAEIAGLLTLIESIGTRLMRPRGSEQRGLAAARLEETMTAALGAVDHLEAALERWGTDLLEQDVQFVPTIGSADDTMSIGQFIRWARATATPFARSDMAAAALRGREAVVLENELQALECSARQFEAASANSGLQRAAPRAQLAELAGYLAAARRHAAILAGVADEAAKPQSSAA
ncbi:hypothetical protein [Sphingomonas sp. 37zxx]|uniref:hypothetical protein n=1 Tax=Sphingomonas sp. 37zxx TaxID=1550073 RepID=UPI00053BE48C|nr:hypothetical protein [Sphingomonas sp. 37zxx]